MQTAVDASSTRNVPLILHIVDSVYAAACGEATWEQVLADLCRFGSLHGAALSTVGAVEPRRVLLASFGLSSPSDPRASHDATAGASGLVDSILRSSPGAVLQGHQIMSDRPTTPPRWTGAVPAMGSIALACVIVGRDDRRVVCLEVHGRDVRAPGRPDPGDLLRQLAPHLVRAWRIGRASRSMLATAVRVASPSYSGAEAASAAHPAGLPVAARLRTEFGLTKAEARLALHLAEGASLASAAQVFNVKLTTIRSQLQQVFAKTGTSRQTELVAMLLSCGYGPLTHHWNPHRYAEARLAVAG